MGLPASLTFAGVGTRDPSTPACVGHIFAFALGAGVTPFGAGDHTNLRGLNSAFKASTLHAVLSLAYIFKNP